MKIILHYPDMIADQISEIFRSHNLPPLERFWNIPPSELAKKMKGASVLLSMQASREIIQAGSPTLKLIHSFGVGVNRIDLEAAKKYNVQVANSPANVQATAEHGFSLLLACAKQLIESDRTFRQDYWGYGYSGRKYSIELKGKVLLIVGLGRIGRLLAKWAHCFGMKVIGIRRSGDPVDGVSVHKPSELDSLLPGADFVVVSTVAIPSTLNLFSFEQFALMKPTAFFINISRGSTVNPEALYKALLDKKIAGAGIDVWWKYPGETKDHEEGREAPSIYPFKELTNIVMTPHRGGYTQTSRKAILTQIVENVQRFLKGETVLNQVDLDLGY